MSLPVTGFGILSLVILAVPGLVYSTVRRWSWGETFTDRSVGLAIARGTTLAVVLNSLYLILFGQIISDILTFNEAELISVHDPQGLGIWILILYILVPLLLSLILNWAHLRWVKSFPYIGSKHGLVRSPTPWDDLVRYRSDAWIKIRRANGDWIGGWYSGGSVASSYPESPSIFIGHQYEIDGDGAFGDPIPGSGVYLTIADDDIVIWIDGNEDIPSNEQDIG